MDVIGLQTLSHHNNSNNASSIMKPDIRSGKDESISPLIMEPDITHSISNDFKRKVELSTLENLATSCGLRTALVIIRENTQPNTPFFGFSLLNGLISSLN